MHYGKTIIVTLIAALTLATGQMANAQAIVFEQAPQATGIGPWTATLGALGAAGGAAIGYNTNGMTSSKGGNTAIGGVVGAITGALIGSWIDNNRGSILGFSRGISAENLMCVRIRSNEAVTIRGTILPPGDYCYCWDKTIPAPGSEKGSGSGSGSDTNLTDEEKADADTAIKNAYRGRSACNHDRTNYYDSLKNMRFAYENESCQTYADDNGQTTEAEAIAMCLKESSTCNKLR